MPELAKTILADSSNLKGYWRFESGALTTDSSGNSHTLTNNNSVAEGTGKFGGGADFATASSQSFSLSDHADFRPSAFSIACWVKTTNTASTGRIISKGDAASNRSYDLAFGGSTGTAARIYFLCQHNDGATNTVVQSGTDLANNTWHHVVATWDGSTMRLYVNGKFDGSGSFTGTLPTTATTQYVGRRWDGLYLNGSIDDLYFFNTALSADQIKELYEGRYYGELRPNQFGTTVGLWHFNGNSTDFSGNNNHGTDTNITYSAANGKFGQGAGFNGSSSKISLGTGASLQASTFTYLAWVNTSNASIRTILAGSSANHTHFRITASHTLELLKQGVASIGTSSGTVPTTGWHLVGVTYSTPNCVFYIDGAVAGTSSSAQTFSFSTFQIGTAGAGSEWFNGNIDELLIASTALTANQIRQLYAYQKGLLGRYA